ncbi:MAG: hypothetical protein AAGG68_27270 [Bacteroidota bacterium]
MRKNIKNTLVIFSLLAFTASFSSCNRGYGCPNNFSIGEKVTEVVKTAVKQILVKPQ